MEIAPRGKLCAVLAVMRRYGVVGVVGTGSTPTLTVVALPSDWLLAFTTCSVSTALPVVIPLTETSEPC